MTNCQSMYGLQVNKIDKFEARGGVLKNTSLNSFRSQDKTKNITFVGG